MNSNMIAELLMNFFMVFYFFVKTIRIKLEKNISMTVKKTLDKTGFKKWKKIRITAYSLISVGFLLSGLIEYFPATTVIPNVLTLGSLAFLLFGIILNVRNNIKMFDSWSCPQ